MPRKKEKFYKYNGIVYEPWDLVHVSEGTPEFDAGTLAEVTVTAPSTQEGYDNYWKNRRKLEELKQLHEMNAAIREATDKAGKVIGGTLTGLASLPILGNALSSYAAWATAHPVLSTGIDAALTTDGIRNLTTENGIKKTYRLVKEGQYGKALLSGSGDALDLLGGVSLASRAYGYLPQLYKGLTAQQRYIPILGDRLLGTISSDRISYPTKESIKTTLLDDFGEKLGDPTAESVVFTSKTDPKKVYKIHRSDFDIEQNLVYPKQKSGFNWLRFTTELQNKIPFYNKETYIGKVFDFTDKRFKPVYEQKYIPEFGSKQGNASIEATNKAKAQVAAQDLGFRLHDMHEGNFGYTADGEFVLNDVILSPRNESVRTLYTIPRTPTDRIMDAVDIGSSNVRNVKKQLTNKIEIVADRIEQIVKNFKKPIKVENILGKLDVGNLAEKRMNFNTQEFFNRSDIKQLIKDIGDPKLNILPDNIWGKWLDGGNDFDADVLFPLRYNFINPVSDDYWKNLKIVTTRKLQGGKLNYLKLFKCQSQKN